MKFITFVTIFALSYTLKIQPTLIQSLKTVDQLKSEKNSDFSVIMFGISKCERCKKYNQITFTPISSEIVLKHSTVRFEVVYIDQLEGDNFIELKAAYLPKVFIYKKGTICYEEELPQISVLRNVIEEETNFKECKPKIEQSKKHEQMRNKEAEKEN